MRRLFILLVVLLSITNVQAQEKVLTMRDAIVGRWQNLRPQSVSDLQWRDNKSYTYTEKYKTIMSATINGKSHVVLTLNELNKALKNAKLKSLRYIGSYKWENSKEIEFNANSYKFIYSFKTKTITSKIKLPKGENVNFCKENKAYAYTKDNNLFLQDTEGNEIAITSNSDKNIVCGQSVSRNEFGIDGGIFWSPNGKNLAFYRKDESAVTNFPLLDITTRTGTLKEIKYPMAGMKSEHITLGIYNLATKKTIWVKPTDFSDERYLTNISWDGKGENLYIQLLNREQNHMKLNKYDAKTGKCLSTLFEEKDDRYVEPQHKLIFLKSGNFIYQTNNRDGYNHFYLVSNDGKKVKHLLKGDFDVDFLSLDAKERNLYYMSREVSPAENHLYKLNLRTLKTTRLTKKEGWHKVVLSKDFRYFTDTYSNTKEPNVVNVVDSRGNIKSNILKAKNPIADYKVCELKLGKIKANDGKTDLYYKMTMPSDFDANKKYPVIVYVYGGPHAQLVMNRWEGANWDKYMAQRGYIVFTLDNRGSAGRGKAFEDCIHRQCGKIEMQDQMTGVKFLKSHKWVDAKRIGVHGWSYGGFMTISLITNYPETFKVAVAGGPVIDWKWYEVMYGERYMDTPQENPEGYKSSSLINKAKDLKGKLLICQGAVDNTVVWEHSLSFVRECIKNNVQLDYFPYPTAEHNVRGYDRIHLKQKISNYFEDFLK